MLAWLGGHSGLGLLLQATMPAAGLALGAAGVAALALTFWALRWATQSKDGPDSPDECQVSLPNQPRLPVGVCSLPVRS